MNERVIYSQFEIFCEFLLLEIGFKVIESPRLQKDGPWRRVKGPDFVVIAPSGERIAVEVKFYQSSKIGGTTIANAIAALQGMVAESGCSKGMLMAPIDVVRHFPALGNIEIWGTEKLAEIATEVGAFSLFEKFLDQRRFRTDGDFELHAATQLLLPKIEKLLRYEDDPSVEKLETGREFEAALRQHGRKIVSQLEVCPEGKSGAKAFETVCFDGLKYLFDDDFEAWKTQKRVEGGFHINDVVARLTPVHDFWKWLSHDFSSRYVIFEFKNYSDEISQGQIYSTEKYLYSGALRKIAVLVARNGCDRNGVRAIKSALREHGKLIVWVTLAELKEMIDLKDRGEEFIGALSERVDELLTDLAP